MTALRQRIRTVALLSIALWGTAHSQARAAAPQDDAGAGTVPPALLRKINEEYLAKVRPVLAQKCFDCHVKTNPMPWYGRVPIPYFGNAVEQDVRRGRLAFDLASDEMATESHAWLGVQSRLRAIRQVVERGSMPPRLYTLAHGASRLTQAERESILDWSRRGLEELIAAEAEIERTGTSEQIVARMLRNRCSRCHNPDRPDEDGRVFPLEDLRRLRMDSLLVGEPPEDGELYEVIKKGKMPPKDLDTPLSKAERQRLLSWITAESE